MRNCNRGAIQNCDSGEIFVDRGAMQNFDRGADLFLIEVRYKIAIEAQYAIAMELQICFETGPIQNFDRGAIKNCNIDANLF